MAVELYVLHLEFIGRLDDFRIDETITLSQNRANETRLLSSPKSPGRSRGGRHRSQLVRTLVADAQTVLDGEDTEGRSGNVLGFSLLDLAYHRALEGDVSPLNDDVDRRVGHGGQRPEN